MCVCVYQEGVPLCTTPKRVENAHILPYRPPHTDTRHTHTRTHTLIYLVCEIMFEYIYIYVFVMVFVFVFQANNPPRTMPNCIKKENNHADPHTHSYTQTPIYFM